MRSNSVQENALLPINDTEIKDGQYKPGEMVENGKLRVESDSPAKSEPVWGSQTQRSLIHFSIGNDWMPKAAYHAFGYVKKAADPNFITTL